MKKLSDLLSHPNKTEKKNGKFTEIDEKTLFFLAEKTLSFEYGIRGRENVSPKIWKDKKLYLSCRNSLWSGEIWMNRDRIREKINHEIGNEEITDIKVIES